jgi:tetratricopeptide (TPR) repeat protein
MDDRGDHTRTGVRTEICDRSPFVWLSFFIFTAGGGLASILSFIQPNKPSLELRSDPHGESVQKATLTGFERELKEAAAEKESEARDYFKAAERDFAAQRYRDAASNYQKSIDVLPTISGYLNLGITLRHIADFQRTAAAFRSGLQEARRKGNNTISL